jgi:hypothetical protein
MKWLEGKSGEMYQLSVDLKKPESILGEILLEHYSCI